MTERVSNIEFAKAVGIDISTASRLRNGFRLPKPELFAKIVQVYELDAAAATRAYGAGAEAFGRFIDEKVFGRSKAEADADLERIRRGQAAARARGMGEVA